MLKYFENASQAVDWIYGLRYKGEKCGLDNMRALLERLGRPQDHLRFVHVAGTNGKGSTCAMLERMLRECGLKTGLFTSPHLMRFGDRIRVAGLPIDDQRLLEITDLVRDAVERLIPEGVRPTAFELGTAVCLTYFAQEQVDIAVMEVGLGGRLDATNVILPEVSLITPIGMDHTAVLGDTLTAIAGEKAGIIKEGVPVAIQYQPDEVREVFHRVAEQLHAPITDLSDLPLTVLSQTARGARFELDGLMAEISLCGFHQVQNAALALTGMRLLREKGWHLPQSQVLSGLKKATWPGRLEWLDDRLLIDGAHNPHGASSLAAYVKSFLTDRRRVLLMGMMKDKDVSACTGIFADIADEAVCTQVDYPRAMPCEELAALCQSHGLSAVSEHNLSAALALARQKAGEGGVVIVCGSLYLVGDIRLMLHDDSGQL